MLEDAPMLGGRRQKEEDGGAKVALNSTSKQEGRPR